MLQKIKDLLKVALPEKAEEIEKITTEEPKEANAKEENELQPKPNLHHTLSSDMVQSIISASDEKVKILAAKTDKLLSELSEIKEKEKNRDKLLDEQAKKERENTISTVIQEAIKAGRIPAKDEATQASYQKLLGLDFETTKQTIEKLPPIADTTLRKNTPLPTENSDNNNSYQQIKNNALSELENLLDN